ncbi:Uncharacterised protein [Mycobacteroides abscessus subsp. abscessus]|nr:Uncharacterised protein [Mycobacteroides abscessus subsp. abscessus]
MLQKIELFVPRLYYKILTFRRLRGPLSTEGRIHEDDVVAVAAGWLIDRIAKCDVRFYLVEVKIH